MELESVASPGFTHPFHDEDADIILRSVDGAQFSAHRIILSKASSVFSDMFTLPQTAEEVPSTVDVTDDAKTVSLVLSYCYPINDPVLDDIDTTRRVLEVMREVCYGRPHPESDQSTGVFCGPGTFSGVCHSMSFWAGIHGPEGSSSHIGAVNVAPRRRTYSRVRVYFGSYLPEFTAVSQTVRR